MGNITENEAATVRVIASQKTWIESEAVRQLEQTAKLAGMRLAVGLPDLHPGKGHPIGAAFLTEGWLYPTLVGSDIGCGMGLWQTDLKVRKIKLDQWASKLNGLEQAWEGDTRAFLAARDIAPTASDASLGTIGGGNHFAELQKLTQIYDAPAAAAAKLDRQALYLLVHSGSRGLGESILRAHTERYADQGFRAATAEADAYLAQHDHAVRWAEANRTLIAQRFMTCLRAEAAPLLDIRHNTVTAQDVGGCRCWLHRKGAAPATTGLVVIPGSRGDYSYLVQPTGTQDANAYSLAHGAGRKWQRSVTAGRLSKYRVGDFVRTSLGSMVICEDKALIFEEAPQAYKNIDMVVGDLVAAGLIKLVAQFCPVLTYKTRRR